MDTVTENFLQEDISYLLLYSAIIPEGFIINDNHGQHYRIHQRNIEWLAWQFESIHNGYYTQMAGRGTNRHEVKNEVVGALGFKMNFNPEDVRNFMKSKNRPTISIRCEVWKIGNRRFDPQNYAKTFKAPLDMLVKHNYIADDSWKFVDSISYAGGGPEVFSRCVTDCYNLETGFSDFIKDNDDLSSFLFKPILDARPNSIRQPQDAVFKNRDIFGITANDIWIRILIS